MELSLRMLSVIVILGVVLHPASTQTTGDIMIKGAKGTRGSISTLGGGIKLYRDLTQPGGNKTMKTAEITVSFLRLAELNSDKQQVTDKNNKTHTMTSFAKQSFTCSALPNTTVPSSSIKADCWDCWTDLMELFSPARFRIMACVTQSNGTITQDREVSTVSEGQVKLSIEITKGWPWCDATCPSGMGKFLDLELDIKLPSGVKRAAKANSTRADNKPTRFELGAGVTVEFSTMSLVDSTWVKLVDNMPALTQLNSSDSVTMRFNRFENKLIYDPTFDTGNLAFDPNSSNRLSAVSFPLLLLITMATAIVTSVIA